MRRLLLLLPLLAVALAAACSDGARPTASVPTAPEPAASDATDTGSVPVYIALGNSLSEGIGASAPGSMGFVPLVYDSLPNGYELRNLGHSGDTSQQLIDHGHLDEAIATIGQLNGDSNEDNDVRLVTLEIGGNDLLELYLSLVLTGICPDVTAVLSKPECIEPLTSALTGFDANLGPILDRLQEADPELRIFLLTIYDPFSGLEQDQSGIARFSLEGFLEGMDASQFPDGLNTIIRRLALPWNITLVDLYPLFENRAPELISNDAIHPNDAGYAVMAEAVIAALASSP